MTRTVLQKNWRRHPKKERAALRAVLNEFGYAGPLLARELPDGRLQLLVGRGNGRRGHRGRRI
jgi:hypothetical protein